MSMSEYEKQNREEWDDLFPSTTEPGLPDDFSEEDVTFARELGALFSPQEEIVPPYFAQTLLEAEDPRYRVVDSAFAQKTSARVFRSLKLRRRLFARRPSTISLIGESVREIVRRKSLMAWAGALLLVMLFTVAFTAPSFEQGVSMLLHGSSSGVVQVPRYPSEGKVRHHNLPPCCYNYVDTGSKQVPLLQARQFLHFNIYWPQFIPAGYSLSTINIYKDSGDAWADGPIVELVFNLNTPNADPRGTGQIVVREFKPLEQVLQVVQDGSAYPIDPDQNGNPRAIYVDGTWLPIGKLESPVWSRAARSEVIYQQNGVVFWIAGDQRDGINQKALWKVAQSLQIMSFAHPALLKGEMATILLTDNSVASPFYNDLLSIASDSSADGQYYVTMSSYIQGKVTASTTNSLPHGQ
ncbi:MAG TPA: hypothetical protein VNE38_15535 [Ktedonobacteraceae bacterium]|nr:hypothetical protein [Ktedonobacteraceae bacterium]